MKILHAVSFFPPFVGGAELYFKELSSRLENRGHDVTVFTSNIVDLSPVKKTKLLSEVLEGVYTRRFNSYVPLSESKKQEKDQVGSLQRKVMGNLARLIKRGDKNYFIGSLSCLIRAFSIPCTPRMLPSISSGNWDVVNAGFLPWSTPFLASFCVKKSATPLIITPFYHMGQAYHDMYSTYMVLNRSVAILVLTQSEKEVFIAHGIPAEKIRVVRGGIDPTRYNGANGMMFRSRHGISSDSFVALFLGTKDFEKGYHHTILAMKEVWKSIASAKLVTIGRKGTLKSWDDVSKAYHQYVCHVIEANSENVIDLGVAQDQDVKDALDASNVLVLPSRAESFGMVYLEAGLFKKPVIGARFPATCEMIVNGQYGYLVKFGDYRSLASHLIELAKNPKKREKIGENWYQRVMDFYRWDTVIDRIEAIYEELVTKTR